MEFAQALGGGFKGTLMRDVPLAGFTTFRIGGPADTLVFPQGVGDLTLVARAAMRSKTPLLVLGKGSNVLIPDRGFRGVAVVLAKGLRRIKRRGDDEVDVEAGCDLNRLIAWAIERELGGLEDLSGIPGSVGGAVRMNAGAYGAAIGDRVEEVSLLRMEEGEATPLRLAAEDIGFSYRRASIRNNEIIYKVRLKLHVGDRKSMDAHRQEVLERRKRRQPLGSPSAGSVFRNPEGVAAGEVIDRCGLKGLRVGDAAVSDKHANFIVNLGEAGADDVRGLIARIKKEVSRREGIELQEEIRVISETGD